MDDLTLTIPALYGDHHTLEVRSILSQLAGVSVRYCSPAFHQVSMQYDPSVISSDRIKQALAERGYTEGPSELSFPISLGERTTRHSAVYAGSGDAMAFSETAPSWSNRPLWPCPGFDTIPKMQD